MQSQSEDFERIASQATELSPQLQTVAAGIVPPDEDWRDRAKDLEQQLMVAMDQYSELARALGFEGDAWFGDVHTPHEDVLARARFLGGNPITMTNEMANNFEVGQTVPVAERGVWRVAKKRLAHQSFSGSRVWEYVFERVS